MKTIAVIATMFMMNANAGVFDDWIDLTPYYCYDPPKVIIVYKNNKKGKMDCYAYNRNSGLPAANVKTWFLGYNNPLNFSGGSALQCWRMEDSKECKKANAYYKAQSSKYRGTSSNTNY